MDRKAIQAQIDRNRELISNASHSDLGTTLLNIIVKGLTQSNEFLVDVLKR